MADSYEAAWQLTSSEVCEYMKQNQIFYQQQSKSSLPSGLYCLQYCRGFVLYWYLTPLAECTQERVSSGDKTFPKHKGVDRLTASSRGASCSCTHSKSISTDHSLKPQSPPSHTHRLSSFFLFGTTCTPSRRNGIKVKKNFTFHETGHTRWVLKHFCGSPWERERIYHPAPSSILGQPTWCTFPSWL